MTAVREALERAGVAPQLAGRLEAYAALLERWARVHNLVRYDGPETLVRRHLLDALAGAPHLPETPGLLVDVGSGAGLPGVPLLLASPGWRGMLVEPRQKRWAFLRTVVRELGLDAEVVRERFEALGEGLGAAAITARALGRHEALLGWAAGALAPGGRVLLWLGREELKRVRGLPGWRVVSSPLPTLEEGFLARLERCFT